MKRIVNTLDKLNSGKRACAVFVLCATTAIALPAQTFTTLYSFDGTDGEAYAGLVQATNGDFYGTNDGTIFKITAGGTLTTLSVALSYGGLVQATNGDFYGTTANGGANGGGTVFKMTPSGTLTTLYNFCSQVDCTDGAYSRAELVQATNGDFYGTTQGGSTGVGGTVFKITPGGTLTTLHNFCSQGGFPYCGDGAFPFAGLVQAANGDFYGTTYWGGAGGGCDGSACGTVFKITPSGTLTTLVSFDGADGGNPMAGLVQATNGDLYGTTYSTVFKITPGGTLTTLNNFCSQSGCTDGLAEMSGLVQATDGNLYGTTYAGGASSASCLSYGASEGCGTIFKITPSGKLTTLYSFCPQSGCMDGITPAAGLIQATNGDLYGTTGGGGTNGDGTFFSLSVGLGPFVRTQTTSGEVGAAVKILGSDLTGATSVTSNGTAAAFTVVSRYLITTTVPIGATTGKVQVVIPSRTLSSNVPFRVP